MFPLAIRTSWRQNRRRASWWVIVLLLGSAIGASVAIAIVFQAIVLKPLPGDRPDEILAFGGLAYGTGLNDPVAWWLQAPGLKTLALYTTGDAWAESTAISSGWIRASEVAGEFFEVFDVNPLRGRLLSVDDERADRRIAVVGAHLWRRIGAGRDLTEMVELRLSGTPYVVVGVLPESFNFPSVSEVWVPRTMSEGLRVTLVEGVSALPPVRNRTGWIGRPKLGASIDQIREQMRALLKSANTTLTPKTGVRYGEIVSVVPLLEQVTRTVKPQLATLFVATGIVLGLAVINCIVYAITRALDRSGEIAVRQSLGASPAALLLGWLADSLLMSAVCVAWSICVAAIATHWARSFLFAFRAYVPPFGTLLWQTVGLAVLAGLVVSVISTVPTWLASRRLRVTEALGGSQSNRLPGKLGVNARRVFVALACCISTILIAGAAVSNATLVRLLSQPLGRATEEVVAARIVLRRGDVDGVKFRLKRGEILNTARGVGSAAAIASVVPITNAQRGFLFVLAGGQRVPATITSIDGDFFNVMRISTVAGNPAPLKGDSVVVSRSLARALWGEGGAVGQTLSLGGSTEPYHVVAVVEGTRTVDQEEGVAHEVYRSFADIDGSVLPTGSVVVEALVACAAACDRDLPRMFSAFRDVPHGYLARLDTVGSLVSDARGAVTIAAAVWSIYAGLAVVVALVGTGTLTAHSVRRRQQELGIRSALGASPKQLIRSVAAEGFWVAALGALVGVGVVRLAATAVQSATRLVEVPGLPVLLVIGLVVTAAAYVTSLLPARAASRSNTAYLLSGSRH